jgi:hypothetical protein
MQRDLPRTPQPDLADLRSGATDWHALYALRLRYLEQDRDRWTPRELAQLRFLRWLAETGRLIEDGGSAVAGAGATDR